MLRIGQDHAAAFGIQFAEDAGQFHLIGFAKLIGCVTLKIRIDRNWQLWRIKIYEIAPACLIYNFAEILCFQLSVLQSGGCSQQIFARIKIGIFV